MHDDFDEADEMIALVGVDLDDAEALVAALASLGRWSKRRGINLDEAYAKATDQIRDTA